MNDQRPDQSTNQSQPGHEKAKQDASSPVQQHAGQADKQTGQHDQQQAGSSDHGKQQGGANNPQQHSQGEQKPKTEQASHQGGGGVRTDHKPQGPGTQK
jgi:hypothetical protein